jgi:prepilin-type processing-associated H-X9-DG protein
VLTPQDFLDGLANTAGVSERLRGSFRAGFDPSRDFWFTGAAGLFPTDTDDDVAQICATLSSRPSRVDSAMGRTWISGADSSLWYNHAITPNSRVSDCSASGTPVDPDYTSHNVVGARSLHPQGVHVLMMDGSVRFVRDGIARDAWRALGTRAGSEPLSTVE